MLAQARSTGGASTLAGGPFPSTARQMLDPLEKEQREIERRRQREAERVKRVLHAKTRTMGVDTDALATQVAEKQERERFEKQRDLYHDDLAVTHAKTITDQANTYARDKRREAEELAFYRREQARDKRGKEMLISQRGVDERDTTFLKFHGEDLGYSQRVADQKAQQQAWLAEQLAIRQAEEDQRRADEAAYAATQRSVMDAISAHESQAAESRAQLAREASERNKQLAQEKKAQSRRHHADEHFRNETDMTNTLSSDLMNEAVTGSAYGAHRTLPYAFKGMTVDQRQRILDEQHAQKEALRFKREKEQADEKDHALQQEAIRRSLVMHERERVAADRQSRTTLRDEHKRQAREKNLKDDYLNRVVYTNPVNDDFFGQFGKSSR